MKKIIVSMVAVLMCVLMLAACGSSEKPSDATASKESAPLAEKTITLTEVLDKINAQFFDGGEQMKLIESIEKFEIYYDIVPDDVAEFAAEVSKNSATDIDEVVLVKAVDETAAKRVAEKLELRLQSQKDLCASYSPELLAIANKCSVNIDGVLVTLIINDNFDEITDFCDDIL